MISASPIRASPQSAEWAPCICCSIALGLVGDPACARDLPHMSHTRAAPSLFSYVQAGHAAPQRFSGHEPSREETDSGAISSPARGEGVAGRRLLAVWDIGHVGYHGDNGRGPFEDSPLGGRGMRGDVSRPFGILGIYGVPWGYISGDLLLEVRGPRGILESIRCAS